MIRVIKFFLSHQMFTNILVIAVILAGTAAALSSRKEGFPEISLNRIIVQTRYPGASAGDVELNVTVPIENEILKLDGITEIISTSEEGLSVIEVRTDESASEKEFQKIYDEVDKAVSSTDDLPDGLDGRPVINEFTSSDIPVLEIAYSGEYENLKPYIDDLEQRLRRLPGVGEISVSGVPDREVQILVDPVLAKQFQVDLRMVAQAVQKRNLEGSGGTLESFIGERKVVFFSKFDDYKEVLNTNILMNSDGYGVKLSDIATVTLVPEQKNLIVRNNAKRGASLTIKKTGSADLIKTVNLITNLLKSEKLPAGITMNILMDQSRLTRDRISLLVGNALMGFALVILILIFVFDFRTALWTAFGIPFTLFGLFIFMKSIGLSINLISLGGFIIIIGMLVDDAIVISEEINSERENGRNGADAIAQAVGRIWLPVAASSLTTMAAFSPLFFIKGFPGKFIWAIPLMVIVGLSISLFESYFILPVHLSHGSSTAIKKKNFVRNAEVLYRRIISKAIDFRYVVAAVSIVLLIFSLFLMGTKVKKDPFPQDAAEGFSIKLTSQPGTPAEETEKIVEQIENILQQLPSNEVIGFNSRIGTQNELTTTTRGTQNNLAIVFVYLHPFSKRSRTALQIIDYLQKSIPEKIGDGNNVTLDLKRLGPPMGKPFEIRVVSNNDDMRHERERQIRAFLSQIEGITDIENDEIEGKNEMNLIIDDDTLSRTALTVEDVLSTLRIAFDGQIVSKLVTLDESIYYRIRLNKEARADEEFIHSLPIANKFGDMINLSLFTRLKEQPGKGTIRHLNGKKVVTIYGNTNLEKISPMEVMKKVKSRFPSNSDVSVEFSGQPVESKLIFTGLAVAAVLAILAIYLIIALIFNSYTRPFIILLSIPLLAIGFAFVLLTHNIPASMMSGIAIVGLMGVIVNNSIIMIHTITSLKKSDALDRESVIDASVSRLRPIFMSTVTTVLGVLPTGYGIGGSDPFLSQMSLVLAYGLLIGTTITLIVIPVVYFIGSDITRVFKPVAVIQ